jgi:hypothetical protein
VTDVELELRRRERGSAKLVLQLVHLLWRTPGHGIAARRGKRTEDGGDDDDADLADDCSDDGEGLQEKGGPRKKLRRDEDGAYGDAVGLTSVGAYFQLRFLMTLYGGKKVRVCAPVCPCVLAHA